MKGQRGNTRNVGENGQSGGVVVKGQPGQQGLIWPQGRCGGSSWVSLWRVGPLEW
jgi:hypothetical protein